MNKEVDNCILVGTTFQSLGPAIKIEDIRKLVPAKPINLIWFDLIILFAFTFTHKTIQKYKIL